jgi:hypothetical protein
LHQAQRDLKKSFVVPPEGGTTNSSQRGTEKDTPRQCVLKPYKKPHFEVAFTQILMLSGDKEERL